jgi:hypothetical protein
MEIKINLPAGVRVDLSQINWLKMFGDKVDVSHLVAVDSWGNETWKDVFRSPEDDLGEDMLDKILVSEEKWKKENPEKAKPIQKREEALEAKRKTIDNIAFYPAAEIPRMIWTGVLDSIASPVLCFADRDERIVTEKFVWPAVCCGAVRGYNSLSVNRIEGLEALPDATIGEIVFHTIDAAAVDSNALESYVRSLLRRADSSDTPTLVHLHNIHNADPGIGKAVNLLVREPEAGRLRVILSAVYNAENKTIKTVLKPWIFNPASSFGLLSE